VDPINLSPSVLAEELERAGPSGPLGAVPVECVQARFVMLLHLNQMLLRVLPFVTLSPRNDIGYAGAGAGASMAVVRNRCTGGRCGCCVGLSRGSAGGKGMATCCAVFG
jgi:hypothetical protein